MPIINILKVLSDENRLRILNIIKPYRLCVGEIQTILNISQSNASRHLDKIKSSGIVDSYKKAQWTFYQISDSTLRMLPFMIELFNSLKYEPVFQKDMARLLNYKKSGLCCQDLRNVNFDYNFLSIDKPEKE